MTGRLKLSVRRCNIFPMHYVQRRSSVVDSFSITRSSSSRTSESRTSRMSAVWTKDNYQNDRLKVIWPLDNGASYRTYYAQECVLDRVRRGDDDFFSNTQVNEKVK